jgi:TPR repeat protein
MSSQIFKFNHENYLQHMINSNETKLIETKLIEMKSSETKSSMNEKFIKLITLSNDKDFDAMNTLHDYFQRNLHLQQDFTKEHIKFYVDGSQEHKPYSTYHLALMYMNGLGVEQDQKEFMRLLDKSCDLECSQAIYYRALVYKRDEPQTKKYHEYLKKAMENQNSNAYLAKSQDILNVGADRLSIYESIYEHYDRLEKTHLLNVYVLFLKEAIRLGNTSAMCQIVPYYKYKKDFDNLKKMCNECCEKGNYRGYVGLGHFYCYGLDNTEKDVVKAIELYKLAADAGMNDIYAIIGDVYLEIGDNKSAEKYYQIGMDKKCPEAFWRAGDLIITRLANNKNDKSDNDIKTKRKKDIRKIDSRIPLIDKAIDLFWQGKKLGSRMCDESRYEAIEMRNNILYGKSKKRHGNDYYLFE